jgi:PilX N-terminal
MRNHARRVETSGEGGFAFILAILALMLLTFLGLTLAATTTTELQIATNYRWGQQALANAEAGIEVGRRYLRQVDWEGVVLPPARTTAVEMASPPQSPVAARNGPWGEANRSWENQTCDSYATGGGGQGLGYVVDDPTFAWPYQNVSQYLVDASNNPLQIWGTFTLWARRPQTVNVAGAAVDSTAPDVMVLTAEGTAPFFGPGSLGTHALNNRAVRYVEVTIVRQTDECENRVGQEGGGPLGSGFNQCDTTRLVEGAAGVATPPAGNTTRK